MDDMSIRLTNHTRKKAGKNEYLINVCYPSPLKRNPVLLPDLLLGGE